MEETKRGRDLADLLTRIDWKEFGNVKHKKKPFRSISFRNDKLFEELKNGSFIELTKDGYPLIWE